jgi:hypothetical protein
VVQFRHDGIKDLPRGRWVTSEYRPLKVDVDGVIDNGTAPASHASRVPLVYARGACRRSRLSVNVPDASEKETTLHVAIRQYRINPRNVDEVTQKVQTGFMPLLRQCSGFMEYYWLNAGNGRVVSVGIFEDEACAEESTRIAADYVRQFLYELVRNPPEVIEGEVLLHEVE